MYFNTRHHCICYTAYRPVLRFKMRCLVVLIKISGTKCHNNLHLVQSGGDRVSRSIYIYIYIYIYYFLVSTCVINFHTCISSLCHLQPQFFIKCVKIRVTASLRCLLTAKPWPFQALLRSNRIR